MKRIEAMIQDSLEQDLMSGAEPFFFERGRVGCLLLHGFGGTPAVTRHPGQRLWTAIADAPGYSVIGGGDSVAAAGRFGVREGMSYVCTSGGGMVRFLSGQALPVVEALRRAAARGLQGGHPTSDHAV
jgi:hypothetical protein